MADDYEEYDEEGMLPEMQQHYRVLKSANAERDKAMESEYYQPQRDLWRKQEEALRARRVGPSFAERMFSLSSALAKPTPYRGAAGFLSVLSPELQRQEQEKREAEETRRQMLEKYGVEIGKLDLEKRKREIEGRQALAETRYKALAMAQDKSLRDRKLPEIVAIAQQLYPSDPAKQKAYILANSPAAVKGISATKDKDTEKTQGNPWDE